MSQTFPFGIEKGEKSKVCSLKKARKKVGKSSLRPFDDGPDQDSPLQKNSLKKFADRTCTQLTLSP